MKIVTLYNSDSASFTPKYEDGYTETGYVRLVADDGMILKKGNQLALSIDVIESDKDDWAEIEYIEDDEEISDEEALSIIMGGAE